MKKISLRFLFCLLLLPFFCKAQTNVVDSLNAAFKTAKNDTTRATIYILLTENLYISKPDTVIPLCLKAIEVCDKGLPIATAAEKKAFLTLKASAFNNMGYIYQNYGDEIKALDNYHKGLKIQEEIGDKKGLAQSLNNIGFVYQAEKDAVNALNYYHKSLRIRQEIGDRRGIGECYNNIGFLYRMFGDPDCKSKVEKVCRNSGFSKGISFYEGSLKIMESIHDSMGISISLNNIGGIYLRLEEMDKALEYYNKSYTIRKLRKDKQGIAYSLGNIALIYLKQKKYAEAKVLAEEAVKVSKELGFPAVIRNATDVLKNIYYEMGDYKKSIDTYTLFVSMRDSINSQSANKAAVKKQLEYEYEKKVAADSVKTAQEKKVVAVELEHTKTQRFALVGGLLLVLIFAAFMFNRFKVTHKQKEIIEDQKHLVEEKQKEIVDSINYAQRIQNALLTSDEILKTNLPEYFIYFKPKDIVSGDFYWAAPLNNGKFALIVADSTGHGVPGAFMSLLNISFLNEAIKEYKLNDPAEILNHARAHIIQSLSADGSAEGGKDGMDCSLVSFDFKNNKLEYAAANNPVWVIRRQNGTSELINLVPDKMPVGKHDKDKIPFTLQKFDLQKGDTVYLFTDGYTDQFGGPQGKKFKHKQLEDILKASAHLDLHQQKNKIEEAFENWKGELEQVDDVLIVGVRI